MAVQALIARLEAEAEEGRRRVLDGARAEAARIVAEADARDQAIRHGVAAARREERRARQDRLGREARARSRARLLGSRRELLEEVIGLARRRLPEVLADRPGIVGGLVAAALDHIDGPAILRLRPCDEPAARAALSARSARDPAAAAVQLELDPAAAVGIEARSPDGRVRVDATLAGHLERLRPAIEVAISRRVDERSAP